MPILRRSLALSFKLKDGKEANEPSDASTVSEEVYYCHSTGEFFSSYEYSHFSLLFNVHLVLENTWRD